MRSPITVSQVAAYTLARTISRPLRSCAARSETMPPHNAHPTDTVPPTGAVRAETTAPPSHRFRDHAGRFHVRWGCWRTVTTCH